MRLSGATMVTRQKPSPEPAPVPDGPAGPGPACPVAGAEAVVLTFCSPSVVVCGHGAWDDRW
jgi:hypothetical protein